MRFDKGLWPFGVMDGIGIELSFQRYATALFVFYTVLATAFGEIAGVDLDTGTIGVYSHFSAAVGVSENGGRIAEHLEIVIIASL